MVTEQRAICFIPKTIQAKPLFGGLSSELSIQPKLTIGAVGDKYEQEADTSPK
ncbi:hypothetical protein [Dulcicalothrix desertica]|uniref:hypothetical protein n=1 Tax=Dulcicalothrix desertica TaxID=32056 RepID=UPI0013152724|nr:hypothetical protein [Dulcicalothrix desertica]